MKSTRYEEEPHRLIQEVYRPVIQELKEVIQPYRKVVQQIEPVIESVHQIISSAKQPRAQPHSSIASNSMAKTYYTDTLDKSASYQSPSTTYQKAIPMDLNPLDTPQRISSVLRSDKIGNPSANKRFILDNSPTQPKKNYPHKNQKRTQNKKKLNNFRDRYLKFGGAMTGLKMEGTVRRLGLVNVMNIPQLNNKNTAVGKPEDYELFELKVNPSEPVRDVRWGF